jgi:lysophospholipid acyltransferase (LPLAT)-like uncharacterized protein
VITPHQASRSQRLAALAVFTLIRVVAATIRFRLRDPAGIASNLSESAFIFAIWHNRLALSLVLYHRWFLRTRPQRRMAALVSASRDGGFLASILERFGVQPVRGSSSRRGPQALRELVSWGERGYDLAITPDGPRGPRYVVQEGAVALAQLTGLPVVPASYHLRWKVCARSWDGFQIPIPFTSCELRLSEPLRVPREADAAARERFRQELEQAMLALTED